MDTNAIEERLQKQDAAIAALKDIPKLLEKLLAEKPTNIFQKGKWSLGISDDESELDEVTKLLGHENPRDIVEGKCYSILK